MKKILAIIVLFFLLTSKNYAQSSTVAGEKNIKNDTSSDFLAKYVVNRRKAQSGIETQKFGYAVFPFPVVIPGFGISYSVLGAFNNIFSTPMSVYSGVFTGAVKGYVLGLADIPVIPDYVGIDLFANYFSDFTGKFYNKRGMDSNKDDYNTLKLKSQYILGSNLYFRLWDWRIVLARNDYKIHYEVNAILDSNGKDLLEVNNGKKNEFRSESYSLKFDFTDDRRDPRKGVEWTVGREGNGSGSGLDRPDYYTISNSVSFYIPVLDYSTLAFNLYDSRAIVVRQGLTDRNAIISKNKYDCNAVEDLSKRQQCQNAVNGLVNDEINQNKFGSASSLGGISRLRSYSQGRFKASKVQYIGGEFRWNLNNSQKELDYYLINDVRTLLQVAFFAETGSVADNYNDLWKQSRSSFGAGIRVVTVSGFVLRFDLAYGSEGVAPVIFFNYPWASYG